MTTSAKAKAMETELQEITLKKFKIRKDFNYRGMKDKIKRPFTQVHHVEDVWIDLCTDKDIRRMDYNRLTLEQIVDLDLADIPQGMVDDEEVLDPIYEPTIDCKNSSSSNPVISKGVCLSRKGFSPSWQKPMPG